MYSFWAFATAAFVASAQSVCLCGMTCLFNTNESLLGEIWIETGRVFFPHGYLYFLRSLYVCSRVCFPSQAPALLLCFVRPGSEQLALAPAHVGNASPFILLSL